MHTNTDIRWHTPSHTNRHTFTNRHRHSTQSNIQSNTQSHKKMDLQTLSNTHTKTSDKRIDTPVRIDSDIQRTYIHVRTHILTKKHRHTHIYIGTDKHTYNETYSYKHWHSLTDHLDIYKHLHINTQDRRKLPVTNSADNNEQKNNEENNDQARTRQWTGQGNLTTTHTHNYEQS